MTAPLQTPPPQESVLASLRRLIPTRACDPREARMVAEAQATRLLALLQTQEPDLSGADGIDVRHIEGMPRIQVAYEHLPVSGLSHWNGQAWIIALNTDDTPARQRFTLLHEFKHIIDHGAQNRLYRDTTHGGMGQGRTVTARHQAEIAADYFAGCALVPKRDLKRAWGNGIQQPTDLADHFGVSVQAITVRLDQTGLSRKTDLTPTPTQTRGRCARPITTPRWHTQAFTISTPGYRRRSYP